MTMLLSGCEFSNSLYEFVPRCLIEPHLKIGLFIHFVIYVGVIHRVSFPRYP